MYSRLTFLLAIGFAASISLPTGHYKYESQILTRAPRGDLTSAGLKFVADVLVAPLKTDSYLVHFTHVLLSSLNGMSPASSWSKIIYDEYWTIQKDSGCKSDLCTLTKPFIIRVKSGVIQDIMVEEKELQLSVNIKKGFAWEFQKLMLQEDVIYKQLPTHYGYCDLKTILKSNATSEQLLKPIKKIHIAPVRETCTQYPTNTDSIINEFKSTIEVMDGKVYNLYTVQSIQLRISKMDQTKFITQVNQTIAYKGSELGPLPPVNATVPYELVPTLDEDKIGGEKFVEKVFAILLSFTQNLTTDLGSTSVDLLHLLRVADEPSLMKLYAKVKKQPRNCTTLYSFLSVAESCEANAVLFLSMEEDSISRVILPEILEKQYRNTKPCLDLVSRLKKIIDSHIWDNSTIMVEKAYMVMSSLTTRYPQYIPEVLPIVEQLMLTNPVLALKMAGNLGYVMKLFPLVQTREEKILALETLRHSNVSDVPKALVQSFKMYANCSEHEEIRMLALKTYLYLSPLNESWTDIKVIQKKNCSKNIHSYIEDIMAVTANRNFPTEKPLAQKACDLKNMLTLVTPESILMNMRVSRAYSLPFYCEKSNMGVALQAEIIHSNTVIELPEDRITIIILKLDTFALDKKMEPLEIQLMLPTEILDRIPEFSFGPETDIQEEIYDILSEIQIRIFIQNVEYTSLTNVQEAVFRLYERYLALQESHINQVAIPINTVYKLPTSVGVVLRKQLTVFLVARAYTSLVVEPLQRILEALPVVLASAEIKVSVENAYMCLKTGSRIDIFNDLRVFKSEINVTESRIRIVKKLSRWQDKSIFYASVTPVTSLQIFRPSGYFVAFNSLSVQTPAKRNYIKTLIGLRKPEVLLEATGYIESESLVKPWTSLFREQYLMVDLHFRQGSDEDLVIDLQRIPGCLKAKDLGERKYAQCVNISISRGKEMSNVFASVEQYKNVIVKVYSNVTLLSETDVGILEAEFEIEIPSKIEPECILNKKYLIGQLQTKPLSSLFSQLTCNQTKYPQHYGKLLDIVGWAVSNEEMWQNYDHMFSEIMPEYIFNDTIQWQPAYVLVKTMKVLSEKVNQLTLTITPNCSEKQKEAVLQLLEILRSTKVQLEEVLKQSIEEKVPIQILMRRELVANWLVQKYSGLLFNIYEKVNRSEELLHQTVVDYTKFVAETIPVWQDNSKRFSSVIHDAAEAVSADLQNLVQETSDYMVTCFKIMTDSANLGPVESFYRILIKKISEITQTIQIRSLGSDVNPFLWIRSQSMVVLQNVADINVHILNKQPIVKSLSRTIRTSRSHTFKLYFTTLYLEKLLNETKYIQNTTVLAMISDLANRTLETIYSMQDIEMYMQLSLVDIVNLDSVVTASRKLIATSEKVLAIIKEIDINSLEDPLAYVSIFDILTIQYHAYIRVKNVAKVIFKIVYNNLEDKNLNEIIKIQEKLDFCCERLPTMSKSITLKDISMSSECPFGQRVQILGLVTWPTHNLTLNLQANLTKSWEQIIWEMLQPLPLSKSAITYKWLDDASLSKPRSIARLQILSRVNAYEEFQIETYVKKGEIPQTWVDSATKAFDKIHYSLFPFFTLKAITLEVPVRKDSCRGVCIQGAVSDRNYLVNTVFRFPRSVYTSSVPLAVLNPIKMESCLY